MTSKALQIMIAAMTWLCPPEADEEEDEGPEDKIPVLAMRTIASEVPGFIQQAIDAHHANPLDKAGLEEFIVNWMETRTSTDIPASGIALYGVPIEYMGFDPREFEHNNDIYVQAREVMDFVATVASNNRPFEPPALQPLQEPLDYNLIQPETPTTQVAKYMLGKYLAPPQDDEESDGTETDITQTEDDYYNTKWRYGFAANVIYYTIWETHLTERVLEDIWLEVADAIGWIFGATGNGIADYSWTEEGENGFEWPSWSDYEVVKLESTAAANIVSRAQRGLKHILNCSTIRAWLAYNIKRIQLITRSRENVSKEDYADITWPTLTTAIQPWAESPARHL